MKKYITLILLCSFLMNSVSVVNCAELIDDSIEHKLKHNLQQNQVTSYQPQAYVPIEDELLMPRRGKDFDFQLEILKEDKFEDYIVDDELMSEDFITRAINTEIPRVKKEDDEFIEKITDVNRVRKIKPKTRYDFSKKPVSINIKLADAFDKNNKLFEGDTISFVSTHSFFINGVKFDKGTTILGRIEAISASDKMGTPENIKIDNFYIDLDEDINLQGSISKAGANRSIWVYPLYQAGNICFWVAGFVFVPIHGGRVKLSTKDTFTVYYEN